MKKIIINSENRRFNISSMVIGYLEENKAEKIEFEIPKEYQNYGKKACFSANGTTFAKLFDNITSNVLTITRDISQFNELDLSIEFFKTENEDEIIARTSILHIVIENAVVCEDVKSDDEKVVILNELIEKVTNLESETTKNEELRQENEQNRIKNEEERVQYFNDIKEKVENGDFNGKDAMINGVNTLEIVEGDNISLQQQANVLTISNTYQYNDSEIKGNIEEIKQSLTKYSLVTETGSKVLLSINSSTYVMTLELKDKNNNTISSSQVDLPLETMVVNATYKDETKEIELTLQNGTKVSFSVADLVSGLVNEDDLNTKLEDYALKSSVPTKTSQLTNDSGFIYKSVNNLDNYYKKEEVDLIKKDVETNTTDIKNLSNRTKRIETDIFDSGEASGTGINLQDSTLAEFQEVKIDGVGKQTTTNGNQLVDMAKPTSKSIGVTSTFENDVLTIVGTAGASFQSVSWLFSKWLFSKTLLENNKGKTIKYKHKSANISNQEASSNVQIIVGYTDDTPTFYKRIYNFNTLGTDTYVIPSDISNISYVNVGIYTNNSANTNVENTVTIEEPLLYFDDNDTYEPYTGAEPSPSPDYEQPIEVIEDDFELVSTGKSILNINELAKFKDNIGSTAVGIWLNLEPNTQYTISTNMVSSNDQEGISPTVGEPINNNAFVFVLTDRNQLTTFNSANNGVGTLPHKTRTVTTTDVGELFVGIRRAKKEYLTDLIEQGGYIQLEKGSTATSFESYTETRQTITLPEDEFAGKIDDTYKDQFRINYNEQDGKYHLYLDKNIGKFVLDGSEDENIKIHDIWSQLGEKTNAFYITNIEKNKIKPNLSVKSNYFKYKFNVQNYDEIGVFCESSNSIFRINKNISTPEQFKQWLSTHNTEVYYVLKEPYTLDLGVVNMPLSYYPITNVYNTCVGIPNMYVKYYRDFKGTIKTMQVDIENLKEAVSTLTSNQMSMDNDISTLQNVVSSSLEEETESEGVTE